MKTDQSSDVILFDGVCNLCDRSVQFVIDRDPPGRFRFASLQSDQGRNLLAAHRYEGPELSSVILIRDGRVYTKSDAALHVARHLQGSARWLRFALVIPRPIRDHIYDWVADRRYRWFGEYASCRMPSPALTKRFIGG